MKKLNLLSLGKRYGFLALVTFCFLYGSYELFRSWRIDSPWTDGNTVSDVEVSSEAPVYKGPSWKAPNLSQKGPQKRDKKVISKSNKPILLLKKSNTLTLRGVVTDSKMSDLQLKLLSMSAQLPNSATIFLVLDTPGGSVLAGQHFINTAKAIPQKIKTVTIFAASMGFTIVQNLGDRLIVPGGILMAHRASISGLSGEIPGSAQSRLKLYLGMLRQTDKPVADRLGMKLNDYYQWIAPEYWSSGEDTVSDRTADKVILARCSKKLINTVEEEEINFLFVRVKVMMSGCPLIRTPISVNAEFDDATAEYKMNFRRFLETYLYHPEKFTVEYITTGKYWKFLE